jgi:hypothetical protein
MPFASDEEIELLKLRLSEKVAEQVKKSLFGFYATIGSVAIAVAGYTGYNAWQSAADHAATEMKDKVAGVVAEVSKQLEAAKVSEQLSDELRVRLNKRLDTLDTLVDEARPKMQMLVTFNQQVDEINRQAAEINQRVNDFKSKFPPELQDALVRVPVQVSTIPDLTRQVGDIGRQVLELSKVVGELKLHAGFQTGPDVGKIQSSMTNIIDAAANIQTAATATAQKPIVYLEYWNIPTEQAARLLKVLGVANAISPGMERVDPPRDGQPAVRYFHKEDQATAQRIANAINGALSDIGIAGPAVVPQPLLDWPNKPKPGVLEAWVGKPSAQ